MNDKACSVTTVSEGDDDIQSLMTDIAWDNFSCGDPVNFPSGVRNVISLIRGSRFPMFLAWGPQLNLLYNKAYTEILGDKHPVAYGQPFLQVWSEIAEPLQALCARTLAGESLYCENQAFTLRQQGQEKQRWFTFSSSPVMNEEGIIGGLYCVCIETTPLVLAQRRQAFDSHLADTFRGLIDPRHILSKAAELLGRQLNAPRVLFGEYDPRQQTVSYHSNYTDGSLPALTGCYPSAQFSNDYFASLESGTTWISNDLEHDPRTSGAATWPTFKAHGIYSAVVVPLNRYGKPVAALFINDKKVRRWTVDEIALIEVVAERTWSAMQRAHAEQALRELNQTLEQRVAETAAERDQIWRTSTDLIVIIERTGYLRDGNPAWTTVLGYAAEELQGRGFETLVHPDDRARVRQSFQQVLDGIPVEGMDTRIRSRDQSYRWISWIATAVHGLVYATGRDVTARRRIEAQALQVQKARANHRLDVALRRHLTAERDRLRQLFDVAPGFMLVMQGPEHMIELANTASYQLVGHRQMVGKTIRAALPELQGQGFFEILDDVFQHAQPFVGRRLKAVLRRTPDGCKSEVYLDFVYQPIINADGKASGIFVQGNEVTEQVTAEETARIASQRWQLAIESSGDGVWEWALPGDQVLYSSRVREILGYSEQEFDNTYQAWESRLHAEDRARAVAAMQGCLSGAEHSFHVEYRLRHKNGSYQWVESHGMVVERGADGEPRRLTGMLSDISDKKQTEERHWNQANFDMLTGLPNRRLFRDRLDQEVQKAQRSKTILALLFIDLDRFKEANDLLGHDVGDELLSEAARRISAAVRKTDTVARLGGDEFTVILPGLNHQAHIEQTAQKIIDAIAEPFRIGGEVVYLSASIGITLHSVDANTSSELIKNADQAMYAAKNAGRNRFSYFTPAMQQAADRRSRMSSDLRSAIGDGQLEVYYQPVVDLANGRITKAEALLRWHHPRWGMIEPALFIPIAEETGQIKEIGDWVFRQAVECARRWGIQRGQPFQIAVNKSPVQFLSRAGGRKWLDHLHRTGLTGSSIAIEITEGLLLNTAPIIAGKLAMYRDSGVQLALDDFGTGYSSMAYLKRFDIDYLKIDQSFVSGMTSGKEDRAIAESIIVMAHRLGMEVIAEGIETQEQKEWLTAAGCNYGQGFLFSQAVPAPDFERMLIADTVLT